MRGDGSGGAFAGTIADLTDAGLRRYMRDERRAIEDATSGPHRVWLAAARELQLFRWALRLRYGARHRHEGGTDSYDRFYRHDEPPTYELAAWLDRENARSGRRHLFLWPEAA